MKRRASEGREPAETKISRLVAGAASGLTLASGLTFPSAAAARSWEAAGDVGAFAAFHFDAQHRIQFGVGIEVRGVFVERIDDCLVTPQVLFSGAVARAELIGWKQTRLSLGPVLGSTNGSWGYGLDATGGVVLGPEGGWLANVGVDGTALSFPNARLGFAIGRDATAGAGLRVPALIHRNACVPGRPLRRGDGRAPVSGGRTATLIAPQPQEGTALAQRAALQQRAGQEWMRRACTEWASVPAFRELAEQLDAVGAPWALSARARDAAADELRHAVLSAELSGALAGALTVELDPPLATTRRAATGGEALARLAFESWQDGCLGEGAAAALADRESNAAAPGIIARAQRSIAADEARHAELAWDILEWLLRAEPAPARALLERAAGGALASQPAANTSGGADDSGLRRFGLLDVAASASVVSGAAHEARARLMARLAA